jgi:RNA polymerase sigma-70 factor, ECF subfamily
MSKNLVDICRSSVGPRFAEHAPMSNSSTSGRVLGMSSDGDLLRRIEGGDLDAVLDLYDRHCCVLFPLALRILGDAAEAEDAVHDAFVRLAYCASTHIPERGSVMAWLVLLVRNLSVDRLRRRRSIVSGAGVATPSSVAHESSSLADESTERQAIRRMLATLTEAERATLECAFFCGLTFAEIAERENAPLATIRSRAARAIALLHGALAREPMIDVAGTGNAETPTSDARGAVERLARRRSERRA